MTTVKNNGTRKRMSGQEMDARLMNLDRIKVDQDCVVEDKTEPPKPRVLIAIATSGLLPPTARFTANRVNAPRTTGPDPAYIEIGDWEPGTKFQAVIISNNPTASFDTAADVIDLKITGRDIESRVAAIYIDDKQMKKLGLTAGHHLTIRAVDKHGNASASTRLRLEGSAYGSPGRALDKNTWVPASRNLNLLDGEGTRKPFILKHMPDPDAPVTKHFESKAVFTTNANGKVTIEANGTLEPGARVEITNGRTGQESVARVGENQELKLALGKDVQDGDVLMVRVSDDAQNRAGPVELRYSGNCKDGRGSSLGIIAARLDGVLK